MQGRTLAVLVVLWLVVGLVPTARYGTTKIVWNPFS